MCQRPCLDLLAFARHDRSAIIGINAKTRSRGSSDANRRRGAEFNAITVPGTDVPVDAVPVPR